jgi:hypothetical protein
MTDPPSRQRGRDKTTHTVKARPVTTSGHESQTGLDTKTDWLTDHRSKCDFDFDFCFIISLSTLHHSQNRRKHALTYCISAFELYDVGI